MSPVVVVVAPGQKIRWAGRLWVVERINYHPGHGPLMAISSLDAEDRFELICGHGCDGPFEVLRSVHEGALSRVDKFGKELPAA